MEIGATRPFFDRRDYAPKTKATLKKVALASIVLRIRTAPGQSSQLFLNHNHRSAQFLATRAGSTVIWRSLRGAIIRVQARTSAHVTAASPTVNNFSHLPSDSNAERFKCLALQRDFLLLTHSCTYIPLFSVVCSIAKFPSFKAKTSSG